MTGDVASPFEGLLAVVALLFDLSAGLGADAPAQPYMVGRRALGVTPRLAGTTVMSMARAAELTRRSTAARSHVLVAGHLPSSVFDLGIRRAAFGLVVAGAAQVLLSLPFTGSVYAGWWPLAAAPVLMAAIGAACLAAWRSRRAATMDRWMVIACTLIVIASLSATLALNGVSVRASNAVVPLVQLGAFAAGLVPGWRTWTAAIGMVAVHRAGLLLAGTGSPTDHLTSALWECAALAAAAAGTVACTYFAARLDDAADELAGSMEEDARIRAQLATARHRASLMHDFVLNHLTGIALGASGPAFVSQLRTTAGQLRDRLGTAAAPSRAAQIADHVRLAVADARASGLEVELETMGTGPPAEDAVGDAFRLVVAEALRNVARHSGAHHATVEVHGDGDRWVVTVADRGRGFDSEAVPGGRLGVRFSVIGRMADVGGDGSVRSRPGVGTVVTAGWPLVDDPPVLTRREAARRRWSTVGELMWNPILLGSAIFALVNLGTLAANRHAYQSVPVVVGVWVVMTAVAAAIWARSRTGIGPGATVAAVLSMIGGSLVMETQLGADMVGPANWAAGYGALALVLLPYTRPAAEVLTGAGVVLVANVWIVAGAAEDAVASHLAALSAVSASSIAVGATLLVLELRLTTEIGDRQRAEARLRSRLRAVEAAVARELESRREGCEREAVDLLEAVADGHLNTGDPATARLATDLAARLRTELHLRLRQSFLQAMVLDEIGDVADGGGRVEVRDDDNLGRELAREHRHLLVAAVREAATGAESVVLVLHPGLEAADSVQVIMRVIGGGLPPTETWTRLRAVPTAELTAAPGRLFLDAHFPRRPDLRRTA